MKRSIQACALAGLLLATAVGPTTAQFIGMPVMASPKGGSGLTLGLNYGKGVNDDSGKNAAWAAVVRYGLSALSIGGAVGTLNPQVGTTGRQTEVQAMANGAYRLVGGALSSFSINVNSGVGYLQTETGTGASRSVVNVPVGLGASINIPLTGFALEPWVSPRANFVRTIQGSADVWRTGYGVSVGINLGVANGIGIQAGFDWSDLDAGTLVSPGDLPAVSPALLGFGFTYTFAGI
jgi:opacity protein-like surface antigen